MAEQIKHNRGRFLRDAAVSIASGQLFLVDSGAAGQTIAELSGDAIRPFKINVSEEELVDLRRRIKATRWPDKETVPDRSQGVQLAVLQELVHYWGTDYSWRKVETYLNSLPQFKT